MINKASNKVKIQIGGGIRSIDSAIDLVKLGVDRVIIGTLAVKQPETISELVKKIGSEHLIIALDYKQGKIAISGWTEEFNETPFSFAKKVINLGAINILFSSVEADGTFSGPDVKNIKIMVNNIGSANLYVAGGIRNEKDIKKLKKMSIKGVIVGKAFYEHLLSPSIIKQSK